MLYNLNPAIWGSTFWDTLYYIGVTYPENPTSDDKKIIINFINAFQYVLPCETCRSHFSQNLIQIPLSDNVLSSRYNFITWLVAVNNEVNKRLNKKIITIEYIVNKYTSSKKIEKETDCTIMITIILIILLIVLLVLYVKFR